MRRHPPPIPLSAAAVAVYLAGLLAGFRGAVGASLAVAMAAGAYAIHTRSLVAGALGLLLASGSLTARATAIRDGRCTAALRARRQWTVELDDEATPGGFARGWALEPACSVRVRLAGGRARWGAAGGRAGGWG